MRSLSKSLSVGTQRSKVQALIINFLGASGSVPSIYLLYGCVTLLRDGHSRFIIHPVDWFIGSGLKGQSLKAGSGTEGQRADERALT